MMVLFSPGKKHNFVSSIGVKKILMGECQL